MMISNRFLLFCTLIIVSISMVINAEYIEYRKIRLVDKTPTLSNGFVNYIFRGDSPITLVNNQMEFAYNELVEYMRNNSLSQGVTLPSEFLIYDIKLIYGFSDELPEIHVEEYFFDNNTNLGQFNTNITLGDITDPNIIPETERIKWAKTLPEWQKDNLPERMQVYRDILYTPRELPVFLYIHCICGCDRTGEVFASYAMKYLGYSFKQAIEWDYSVAGRIILPNHQWAANWYCLYLLYVEGMDIDCTTPDW